LKTGESNIYLIGPMGSGKTSIGLIFDVEGEVGFRERESQMLRDLSEMTNVLVSTGGGVILRPDNCEILSRTGTVVYLQTSVQQQLQRLQRDKSRPLLQSGDREKKLKELAQVRDPLYESLADLVFQSQNRSLAASADLLVKAIQSYRTTNREQQNPHDRLIE
jgi:shikimate kinase